MKSQTQFQIGFALAIVGGAGIGFASTHIGPSLLGARPLYTMSLALVVGVGIFIAHMVVRALEGALFHTGEKLVEFLFGSQSRGAVSRS